MGGQPARCRSQRGFAVLAVAVVIVMIAAAIVAGWSTLTSVSQANEQGRSQRDYLSEVGVQLAGWYRREMGWIDAVASAPDPQRVRREAGITPRWRLRVEISDRLLRDGIGYRVMVAWLPGAGDTSVLDAATGVFTPAPNAQWMQVSGFELQSAALGQTRAQMSRLAQQLEIGYRVRHLSDPSRDVSINRFRAVSCAAPGSTEFPCLDSYQPVGATAIPTLAGLDPQLAFNAWGGPVEASNRMDSSLTQPYSMALRTATPWGSQVGMIAVASP